jgi:hypothetical protein
MPVENYLSDLAIADRAGAQVHVIDRHSKLRIHEFEVAASSVTLLGDPLSTFDLHELPLGRIRIYPIMSRLYCSALGAARLMSLGHRAYSKAEDLAGVITEPEDPIAFGSAIDVSAAVNGIPFGTLRKFDIVSRRGARIFARVTGGTVPIGATMSGLLMYSHE